MDRGPNMSNTEALERAALDAHRRGAGWSQFMAANGAAISTAEPWNVARYHRLTSKLLGLVVSGNLDGHLPIAIGELWGQPEPWADLESAET
jgi:hypothetical protein